MRPIDPVKIRLEASSACQLRCPSCPTAQGVIHKSVVGTGMLKYEHFQRLLDENPQIKEIGLSNWGEVMLNPELVDILAYAHQKQVKVNLTNGVNLNNASDEALEALVKYQVAEVAVSIDGASQETYAQYRVRGHYDTVIANVVRINEFKRRYQTERPRLIWQFVVFGHNEHEIKAAKSLAKDLNMTFRPKLNWDPDFSPIRDRDQVLEDSGLIAASRTELWEQTGKQVECLQLWSEPQINWDGTVLGCCVNYWEGFGGNAFDDGLIATVNSEKITYARDMLMGKAAARDDVPCARCSKYQRMVDEQKWITKSDILLQQRWVTGLRPYPRLHRMLASVVTRFPGW